MVLDHLCENRICVRPSHLDATTQRENLMRAKSSPAYLNSIKTHCKNGHALTGDNLYIRKDRPLSRGYKACRIMAVYKFQERKLS